MVDENRRGYNKQWYQEHKAEVLGKIKERYQQPETKARKLEYSKQYYQKHREEFLKRSQRPEVKAKRKAHSQQPEVMKLHCKRVIFYHNQQKKKVFSHYSNGLMQCACCGENHLEFLSINHINGGGRKHREEIKTNKLYRWLIKNNYPEGFNILCMNCNFALGHAGHCPHQNGDELIREAEKIMMI